MVVIDGDLASAVIILWCGFRVVSGVRVAHGSGRMDGEGFVVVMVSSSDCGSGGNDCDCGSGGVNAGAGIMLQWRDR